MQSYEIADDLSELEDEELDDEDDEDANDEESHPRKKTRV